MLRKLWKRSRGNVIIFILFSPWGAYRRRRNLEGFVEKYQKIFVSSNEELKKQLPKAEKKNEKMFLKTFIDLNNIAIEMNPLLLQQDRGIDEWTKTREEFLSEPTTEKLLRMWNIMRHNFELETKIAELKKAKADIQDKVMKYKRRMTKFDRRDIEDFWRAILTDLAISYTEKKVLFVGTPIEILLKSSRITDKIREAFFLTELLRVSAEEAEEAQNRLVEWFIAYEEKT